ncbi:hypothetical protein K7X08_020473 [Anisodus acutangulus]|uniref:Uncharacterized protein n=1 Tax=Anisodus acutangulus TaxID=402998 RepID=A0A9Q1M6H1_9SOLA|nr:hypothetical protein K7X08_020473 [Anisodus acutangulus]
MKLSVIRLYFRTPDEECGGDVVKESEDVEADKYCDMEVKDSEEDDDEDEHMMKPTYWAFVFKCFVE